MAPSSRQAAVMVLGACLTWALTIATPARATYIGGTAALRAWASSPPLHDPITITHYQRGRVIVLPANHVFRYLNAAAGPLTGKYAKYGRYVWQCLGMRDFGADAWSIATTTTSRQLTLRIGGGQGFTFRFRVDGSLSTIRSLPGQGWESYDVTIRFPSQARRTVILQMMGYHSDFEGAIKPVHGRLSRPTLRVGPRTIFLGDSWTAGDPLAAPFLGYVQTTAELLGLGDAWASGIGGTSYVNGGPIKITWGKRLQSDVLRWHPATVIVAGGSNDFHEPLDKFERAVRRLYTRLRRALPQARIFAVGPWSYSGIIFPEYTQFSAVIKDAVTSVHGDYIDPSGWITGTGSTLKPVHDGGNASRYIGKLNHPNILGYRYIGTRLAEALEALPANAGR